MAAFCDDHWRHSGSFGVKELMIAVERAVRPVRAEPRRKMKMRQELLAHLTSAYEEALSRLGNEDSAREEAVRRFGNPTDLTRELQASVPFYERVLFTPVPGTKWLTALERCLQSKEGESPSRRAMRWLLHWFLSLAALLCLLWGPALVIYQSRHDAASAVMAAEWFAGTGGMLGVFLLCAYATYLALSGSLRGTAILRATVFAGLALGIPSVGGAALAYGMLDLPIRYGSIAGMAGAGFVLLLGASFAARFYEAAQRRREEWTKLEIGD
jgi:hypothetical protein